nr:MAG TPA: hypothetical protein [Caudoviricetes sp.]
MTTAVERSIRETPSRCRNAAPVPVLSGAPDITASQ